MGSKVLSPGLVHWFPKAAQTETGTETPVRSHPDPIDRRALFYVGVFDLLQSTSMVIEQSQHGMRMQGLNQAGHCFDELYRVLIHVGSG
jgi:hypothetical protein